MPGLSLHATAIVIGEAGVLIRGPSGAGKSSLARALLALAGQRGQFARLIGDDRIFVEEAAGRLLARGHPAISGLIEARGVGILPETPEPSCIVRLVIDLADAPPPRLPEGGDRIWKTLGTIEHRSPTPYPSPQGGGASGESEPEAKISRATDVSPISSHGEAPISPMPLPLVGRGKGWGASQTRSSRLPDGETTVISGVSLPLLTLGPEPDRAELALTRLCLI